MRTAVTLAGNADKLVFTPDISTENTTARVAEMCGKAIISEKYVISIKLGTSVKQEKIPTAYIKNQTVIDLVLHLSLCP